MTATARYLAVVLATHLLWVHPASAQLFVDASSSSAVDNCATNGSFANPLQSVGKAVECLPSAPVRTIIVLCHASSGSYCTYALPTNNTFPAQTQLATMRGEPYQMVRFTGPATITIEDNWAIHGVVFDGMRGTTEMSGGTFVRLKGSGITFTHNEVFNSGQGCLGIIHPSDDNNANAPQFSNVVVSHNFIHSCRTGAPTTDANVRRDRHCVTNHQARHVRVLFNDITECGGDGFQIENYLIGSAGDPPRLTNVADSNLVVGNRIWASCVTVPGRVRKVSWGENAIDVKRAGVGLVIRDNIMWGYRKSYDLNQECHGTGSGSVGDAIVVHGTFEKKGGGGVPCTGAPTRCAVIEGNDISNSQGGIAIGSDGDFPIATQGTTRGVDVRGNYIHDLRGVGGLKRPPPSTNVIDPNAIGFGISLLTSDSLAVPADSVNRVYRNTIVSTPGNTFLLGSIDHPAPKSDEYARGFAVRHNVISWNGASPCSATLGTYPDDHRDNYWNSALPPTSTTAQPEITTAVAAPFRISLGAGSLVCGDATLATPDSARGYIGLPYDYRYAPATTAFENKAGTVAMFGERHGHTPGMCGASYDVGADERCPNDKKIFMRESNNAATNRDDEYFTDPVWWLSPDIGMWDDTGVPWTPIAGDVALPASAPVFSSTSTTKSKLVVRIRSSGGTPTATDPIRLRIWGAPYHTAISFPREYTLYVDTVVYWDPSSTAYLHHSTAEGWFVYGFEWSVSGAFHPRYVNQEHFCIRAEISTAGDWKPPFTTHIARSNNLAQRNVNIVRQSVSVGGFLFAVSPTWTIASRIPNGGLVVTPMAKLILTNQTRQDRPSYLYLPINASMVWAEGMSLPRPLSALASGLDRDGRTKLPLMKPGGIMRLRPGENVLLLQLPRDGSSAAQIIVDSREAGRPSPRERIFAHQVGGSGFEIQLASPGYRESFEWGFPRGWMPAGGWRIEDRFRPVTSCSVARSLTRGRPGRRFVVFGRANPACPIRSAAPGRLTSPRLFVPSDVPAAYLSFDYRSHASEKGKQSTDLGGLQLQIVDATDGTLLEQWRQDVEATASSSDWLTASVDLSAYRGRAVRLRFLAGSESQRTGTTGFWLIDNIELR